MPAPEGGRSPVLGGGLFNTLLVISSVAIMLLGVYTAAGMFGLEVS